LVTEDVYARATALLSQLQSDLDAIASAAPDSRDRRRAITAYTSTYASLGRLRLDAAPSPL
jgi:hypothetical protein